MFRRPLITFVTRACRRPEKLARNIESIKAQTSQNWEQLLLVDRLGRHNIDPILWANTQFQRYANRIRGDYIYTLDDDGYLLDSHLVDRLGKHVHAKNHPTAVLVRMRMFNLDNTWRTWPDDKTWALDWERGRRPEKWVGTGTSIITRADVWREHISNYQHSPGGDWHFITSIIERDDLRITKLNIFGASSPGRGCGIIFEKCGFDWFNPFPERYDLHHLGDDAWEMRP